MLREQQIGLIHASNRARLDKVLVWCMLSCFENCSCGPFQRLEDQPKIRNLQKYQGVLIWLVRSKLWLFYSSAISPIVG